jgi:arylformamidase
MNIYDVSLPVSTDLPVWPGDPPIALERTSSIQAGAVANVTRIVLGSHAGTHVDAPRHFFEKGRTADEIPLEACIGPCLVIEHVPERPIEREDLDSRDFEGCRRILFKTRNSDAWARARAGFTEHYVSLGLSAALSLVERKTVLVGLDYLSIEAFNAPGNPVHSILLENEIVIVEGLDLSAVRPGKYELICLPLKIAGSDGAPARAVLRRR